MGRWVLGWIWLLAAVCSIEAQAGQPLKVVSSIAPVNMLVTALIGPEVQAYTLLNANSDPHEFSLRLSDRTLLAQADLVIWLGPNFERFLVKALPQASAQLELDQTPGLSWPAGRQGLDLHLWLNPSNAKLMAGAIAARLSEQLPTSKEQIQQRLVALNERIDTVNAQIQTRLKAVKQVPFGVGHDGYGHWVSYFGLNQVAALSVMPDQHLGAKHLAQVQQQLIGARCVITDFAEGNQQKLQALLQLPVVVADPLAQARKYSDYGDFLLAMADVFSACLSPSR